MVMAKMMNSETNWLESASPTPATPPQPFQHPHCYDHHHRVQNENCFNCGELGHWANRCPLKTPSPSSSPNPNTSKSTPSPSSSSPFPLSDHPAISCPRCQATCTVKVSQSENNPHRKYYMCPPREKNVKYHFFKWCDDVIDDWDRLPPSKDRPTCKCRAGTCRLMLEVPKEPNVSPRYYFVCPIEKGHGACNFRQNMDDISAAIDTMNGDLHEGGELGFGNSKKRKLEALVQHFAPPETVENVGETFIEREENELTPSLSTLRDMVQGESLDLIMEKEFQVSSPSSRAIHHRQAEFWRQISAAGDTSIADPISQFLGHHILVGWLGRLAFPPSGCLSDPPSRPFLCCVFPSFNPIYVPKDVAVTHSENLNDQPNSPSNTESDLSRGTQCSSGVLLEPSSLNNLGTGNIQQGTNGDGQNLEALGQLVLHCQNHLLARLESMSLVDIETVTAASERHLDVVSHVLAGYKPFSERVRKFIACASLLAEIEESINMDASLQKVMMERYQIEEVRYDNLCRSHGHMVDAIAASDEQLERLRRVALRLKEVLIKIENQVNDGEAENRKLKRRASEISKDMLECEKKMKGARKEVEAAKKAGEKREAARSAAKVALEEARSQLRQ